MCPRSRLEFHMAPALHSSWRPTGHLITQISHSSEPAVLLCTHTHKAPSRGDVQALPLALQHTGLQTPAHHKQPDPYRWSRRGRTGSSHHPATINTQVMEAQNASTTRPAFPGDAAGRSGVCARPLATSCSGHGANVSQGLKQQLFLAGRCCEAVTPARHAKNVRRECSVSSQISLENRNIRFVQLISQRKGTSHGPPSRNPG